MRITTEDSVPFYRARKVSSDRILARLAGFDFHLAKPFESNALLELIAPLAQGSKA